MSVQHRELAAGRWQKMPFVEQMANVGGEVERALNRMEKSNDAGCRMAIERALELLDLTVACSKELPRLRELSRAREAIVDHFWGSNEFTTTASSWRKYFTQFALAARRGR